MGESVQSGKSKLLLILALAAIAAIAITALIVAAISSQHPEVRAAAPLSSSLQDGEPHILSEAELYDFGAENGPVYWAGPREDVQYELTYTTAGSVYIRYLPAGVSVGDDNDAYLTVGNYMVDDGYNQLIEWGAVDGNLITPAQSGAVIVTQVSDLLRAYFAFPDASLQVEVFHPEEGKASELVSDGSLVLLETPR